MNHLSGPTLKHFILKQQIINLYRHAIRASKGNCALTSCPHFFLMIAHSHTRSRDKEGDYSLVSQRIRAQ